MNGGTLTILCFNTIQFKFILNQNGFSCSTDSNTSNNYAYSATNHWVYSACSITIRTINLLVQDLSSGLPYKTSTSFKSYPENDDFNLDIVNILILNTVIPGILFFAKDFKLWSFGYDTTVFFMNKNK